MPWEYRNSLKTVAKKIFIFEYADDFKLPPTRYRPDMNQGAKQELKQQFIAKAATSLLEGGQFTYEKEVSAFVYISVDAYYLHHFCTEWCAQTISSPRH